MAIRIPRTELDYAIEAVKTCAKAARDRQGMRIVFPITDEDAERIILSGLSMVAPGKLPHSVMPMDVVEMDIVREPAMAPTRDMDFSTEAPQAEPPDVGGDGP